MIEYNLRKGDLITTAEGAGLLIKQTKKYWYYFYKGHIARISKKKLWYSLDSAFINASISFGSDTVFQTMKFQLKGHDGKIVNLANHQLSFELIVVRPGDK